MDGDGQHPPSLLPTMIEKWRTCGADIVQAVKVSRGRESANEQGWRLSILRDLEQAFRV